MTIARKLALLVIVSLFGLLLLGGQAFYGLHNVQDHVTDLADNALPSVDVITNV